MSKHFYCPCSCHDAYQDQLEALNLLCNIVTYVMPAIPKGTNCTPLVDGVDEHMDGAIDDIDASAAPRTGRLASRMWTEVVIPARCRYRDADSVAQRMVWAEESMQNSDDQAKYLTEIRAGLRPLLIELHAVAVDYEPDAQAEPLCAEREKLADYYLSQVSEDASASASAVDTLLESLSQG